MDPHWPEGPRLAKSEIRLVEHLYRQVDRLGPEVDHQHLALEIAIVIHVHLDPRSAAVNLLGNDTTLGEHISNFIEFDFERNGGDKHRRVDPLLLGLLRIGLERL